MLAVALIGCGGDPSGKEVAEDWVEALNDRDWERACELTRNPEEGCEQRMRRGYDGGTVKLRPPRSYQSGGELNDNEETFAFDVEGASANVGFLRIVDDRVDVEIVIID